MNAKHMSKWTPGPWYVLHNGVTGQMQVRKDIGDTSYAVAALSDWSEETEANARLIAAAPELLAVLHELQESAAYWSEYDVPLGITERINAAIAKATGEQQ